MGILFEKKNFISRPAIRLRSRSGSYVSFVLINIKLKQTKKYNGVRDTDSTENLRPTPAAVESR